jgi:hypothetical protein
MIIYGKRRTVLMVLLGYLIGAAVHTLHGGPEVHVIGYVIPGLIAMWIDRQGVIETLSALVTAAVVVRLVLVIVAGSELVPS